VAAWLIGRLVAPHLILALRLALVLLALLHGGELMRLAGAAGGALARSRAGEMRRHATEERPRLARDL
jgi:hypothetical protein